MPRLNSEKRKFVGDKAAWRIATVVTVVSGLFSLVVAASLIANYLQIRAASPLDNPELLELREQLAENPDADDGLVQQIRVLDLLSRKAFFTSQAHLKMGGQLLLGGVVVFLIALKFATRWNPKPPLPGDARAPRQYWGSITRSRELLTVTAVCLVVVALVATYFTPTGPASTVPKEVSGTAQTAATFPTWETMLEQWPSFRGPGGYGVAHYTTAPTQWDGATGEGIRWKTEAPLPGFNSPVVWENRLFISGATTDVREVYCFDTETGDLLWQSALTPFPGTPEEPPEVGEETGYAALTMAVHGDRAFAAFGNGDLACFDFQGNLLWGKNVGVPDNHYGHSSSLIAFEGLLFVQFDDHAQPRLLALDVDTGKEAWIAQREKISWASPVCVPTPLGMQLILASERNVDAYDPETGALLWTQECLDGEVAPSPAYANGMVFVANEYAMATAVRLSETDGAVQSEVAWQWDEYLPDVASPVATDDHFYIATSMGDIVCIGRESGETVWLQEFDEGFYSSPILVGDRIYAMDREGVMHIFGTGPAFELISAPELHEPAAATPAYLDKRIYVRTHEHLLCIEAQ